MPAGAPQPTRMTLQGDRFLNVLNPQRETGASQFAGLTVHAVAAIGNPERFFGHLRALGIVFEAHAFPDHHDYRINDLAFGDASVVIMTEKDAVKCRPFATQFHWALRVDAEIDGDLTGQIMRTLGKQI
jgi:tetraacyldisaccharide 4'-kinase